MQITIQKSTCKWHKFSRGCCGSISIFLNMFPYYMHLYVYIWVLTYITEQRCFSIWKGKRHKIYYNWPNYIVYAINSHGELKIVGFPKSKSEWFYRLRSIFPPHTVFFFLVSKTMASGIHSQHVMIGRCSVGFYHRLKFVLHFCFVCHVHAQDIIKWEVIKDWKISRSDIVHFITSVS